MPQAEILRIIDVHGPAERPRDDPETRPNRAQNQTVRMAISKWEEPPDEQVVLLREAKPTIALEHVPLPEELDDRLILLREPASTQARAFRSLWHRILAITGIRVVSVTSARPGEGKTTCAVNLALAMAEDAMMRVLVVDTNLKRPGLGHVFGFEPAQSLIERVSRSMDLFPPYPVASISGTRVHVAALPSSCNGTRLERSLFSAALTELRNAYDYIVIDAASVFESADADVVGECSDAVILAARAGVSRKAELRRASDELRPASVIGTVLFDV
jgi:Mrp family chromosome partitioning ATPase